MSISIREMRYRLLYFHCFDQTLCREFVLFHDVLHGVVKNGTDVLVAE